MCIRDAGKNYPRSIRKGLAGTIVERRSRTEEGKSHEQPVKLDEVAVNGLLRVSHQVKRAVTGLTMFQKSQFWGQMVFVRHVGGAPENTPEAFSG